MKRIVIDGEILCTQAPGLRRYMIGCLQEVDKLITKHKLKIEVVYPSRLSIIDCPKFKNIKVKPLFGRTRDYIKYTLPLYVKMKNAVFVGMTNDIPVVEGSVICLHDIIPIKPVAQFDKNLIDDALDLYSKITSKCKYIVTVSHTSKNDIVEQLKVPEERVLVIPNGWEHVRRIGYDDTIFEKYCSLKKGNYYYAIGSIFPYKNFKWIIEVARRNPDDVFAIAGAMTGFGDRDGLEQEHDNIFYLGRVTDEENASLMKNCKAFMHPSLLEGFGIPPMEALAQGRPIIISNASCLPEIYGGAAHYIDPYKYDYNLDLLLSEPVDEASTVLNKYSWEISGKLWYELFQRLSMNEG